MRVAILALAIAALTIVTVAGSPFDRVEMYNRPAAPRNWNVLARAIPTATTTFYMSLRERNLDELERRATAIADPDSDEYLNFMTRDELYALTAPAPETFDTVFEFLGEHGIDRADVTVRGSTLTIHATVAAIEKMFATECYLFQHNKYTSVNVIRQLGSYSLPPQIAPLVELILDISTFPSLEGRDHILEQRRAKLANQPQQSSGQAMIPQGIAVVYSVPYPIKPLANANVSHGVIEFVGQTYNESDLKAFSAAVGVPLALPTPDHIYGPGKGSAQVEATLDIQYIEGVNPASTPWFWIEGENATITKWMFLWGIDTIAAVPNVPDILSVSYGLPEVDQCTYFNNVVCKELGVDYAGYILASDRNFQKFGALGITAIVCSQDRGVQMTENPHQAVLFNPEYPGTSLWVTSVGATEFVNATYNLPNPPALCQQYSCVSGGVEGAVSYSLSGYLSGGGFSNVTMRADWQDAAVKGYVSSGVPLPSPQSYNVNGRGFPDVSAVGHNAWCIYQGQPALISGTSESTPIFAAIMSLLLAEFQTITGKNFGFLNPLLYKMVVDDPQTFQDIVVGDNCSNGPPPNCMGSGFITAKGWDPVTGLGTPNYAQMLAYVQQLAHKYVAKRNARLAAQ